MTNPDVLATRTFQVWLYSVGHASLLLRSTPTKGAPTRVDVLFKGVRGVHLPDTHRITGLNLTPLSPLTTEPDLEKGESLYGLDTPRGPGWIIASVGFAREDQGDYADPSTFDIFAPPGTRFLS